MTSKLKEEALTGLLDCAVTRIKASFVSSVAKLQDSALLSLPVFGSHICVQVIANWENYEVVNLQTKLRQNTHRKRLDKNVFTSDSNRNIGLNVYSLKYMRADYVGQ